jgi:hypothetical protein
MKGGRLYDGDTLDELWPQSKPYGLRPWASGVTVATPAH